MVARRRVDECHVTRREKGDMGLEWKRENDRVSGHAGNGRNPIDGCDSLTPLRRFKVCASMAKVQSRTDRQRGEMRMRSAEDPHSEGRQGEERDDALFHL